MAQIPANGSGRNQKSYFRAILVETQQNRTNSKAFRFCASAIRARDVDYARQSIQALNITVHALFKLLRIAIVK